MEIPRWRMHLGQLAQALLYGEGESESGRVLGPWVDERLFNEEGGVLR